MENSNSTHYTDNMAALRQMEKTIDDQSKTLFEISIKYEGCRNANREISKENDQLKTVISIMSGYLFESLDLFEAMFDNDEAFCSVERMQEYVTIAKYMEARYNRRSIVEQVERKINELPFN